MVEAQHQIHDDRRAGEPYAGVESPSVKSTSAEKKAAPKTGGEKLRAPARVASLAAKAGRKGAAKRGPRAAPAEGHGAAEGAGSAYLRRRPSLIKRQKESIRALEEYGLSREEIAAIANPGLRPESVATWLQGNNLARAAYRRRLADAAAAAREGRDPKMPIARVRLSRIREAVGGAAAREVLERGPMEATEARIADEFAAKHRLKPGRQRARRLAQIIARSGITKTEVAKELQLPRRSLYDLLDPQNGFRIALPLLKLIVEFERRVEKGVGVDSTAATFYRAAIHIFGASDQRGSSEMQPIIRRAAELTGYSERVIRRWLPPYPKTVVKGRRVVPVRPSRALAAAFEAAAARFQPFIKNPRTATAAVRIVLSSYDAAERRSQRAPAEAKSEPRARARDGGGVKRKRA